MFGISNESFFSSVRPIFFEEKAFHANYIE